MTTGVKPPSTTGFRRLIPTPIEGRRPDHVAVDKTVIRVNEQRYWLDAALDPVTNHLLHVRLFTARTTPLIEMFLTEFCEEHLVDEALFLVDGTPWLQAVYHNLHLRFQHETYENRNSVERVQKELKR